MPVAVQPLVAHMGPQPLERTIHERNLPDYAAHTTITEGICVADVPLYSEDVALKPLKSLAGLTEDDDTM